MRNIDTIPVDLDRVKACIASCKTEIFTTADILREYSGGFYKNTKTPASHSFNALFGKLLKDNTQYLNIKEIRSGVTIKDDNHAPTTASEWKLRS